MDDDSDTPPPIDIHLCDGFCDITDKERLISASSNGKGLISDNNWHHLPEQGHYATQRGRGNRTNIFKFVPDYCILYGVDLLFTKCERAE